MAKEKDLPDQKKRLIKILVDPEDQLRLKMAALMSDQSVAEFCKGIVVAKAREVTKGIQLSGKPGK